MNQADDGQRSQLRLDRSNRKLLGVCAGLARYLEVPAALVRVIYCIACLVSPVLLLAYFILYWLLEDEERPARLKAAMTGFTGSGYSRSGRRSSRFGPRYAKHKNQTSRDDPPPADSQDESSSGRRTLYRSRKNVRIGGVCAGLADYLGVRPLLVRLLALVSLFVLGGVTVWGYVILWIILEKAPERQQPSQTAGTNQSTQYQSADNTMDLETCAMTLRDAERRLRKVEAFVTSRQFRLHCEINRI